MTEPLTPLDIGNLGSTAALEAEVEDAITTINTAISTHSDPGDEIEVTFGAKVPVRAFLRLQSIYQGRGGWGQVTISKNRLKITLSPSLKSVDNIPIELPG